MTARLSVLHGIALGVLLVVRLKLLDWGLNRKGNGDVTI
jgi:hypothetical protein